MMKNNIIAYHGTPGAHADLACRKAYPEMTPFPCSSFLEAIAMVEDKKAQLCMIPIENSNAGRVAEIHNLLPKTNLHIVKEYFLPIEHHLLGVKGAELSDIKEVSSHHQALMQCDKTLLKLLPKALKVESSNTAVAAKNIADLKDRNKAAIASEIAAELYGLNILAKNVEDSKNNTTVFIAMSSTPIDPDPEQGRVITSLIFTARNIPSALFKALGGFATNQVNLLKIESYIPTGQSQTAQFFISFEGSPNEKNVNLALEELGFFCRKVKVLGVYYADDLRDKSF